MYCFQLVETTNEVATSKDNLDIVKETDYSTLKKNTHPKGQSDKHTCMYNNTYIHKYMYAHTILYFFQIS